LEPLILRFRPRCDGTQHLAAFSLELDPPPAGLTEWRDAEGNDAALAWFNGMLDSLTVTAEAKVETLRHDPFDFLLIDPGIVTLPVRYDDALEWVLAPCRLNGAAANVSKLGEEIREASGGKTIEFLGALTARLNKMCEVVVRETGDPLAPEKTLAEKQGSCRDLTVLFNAVCRSVGLASRFVSGYQAGDRKQEKRYLHAWSEVYLPGAGWRGYDPTLGLAVADEHVAVAASYAPAFAGPLVGTFRGTGVESFMAVDLEIETKP
ncbi:MAG: transglutaminase family protein, partial [bacterium]|nr:transglutaminase family protein [bacterium]